MSLINLPGFVDNTNFKFLNIDEKIIVSIVIQEYTKYTEFLQIIEAIPKNMNFDISMYIKKQDTGKVLKDLTYKISSSNAEIKTINKNQIDIDLINNVKNDAINLRKDIQINNQEIFNLSIVITFYSKDFKELIYNIKSFQSILYSKGLISSITNFRHLDSYMLSLPLNKKLNSITEINQRCFTTDSLSLNFPFYIKNVFDLDGIIFGFVGNENKLCNINIFDDKYLNSNMCIFGSSGSGKSYFTKLLIIRHFLVGKSQFIFDLEGEYINLLKNMNLKYINFLSSDTYYFNILEVQEYELKNSNWFESKVNKVCEIITSLSNISSIKDVEVIKDAITKTYNEYKITDDINSLYEKSSENLIYIDKKIISSNKFPTIENLVKNIKSKKILKAIKDNILQKYTCICKNSNCSIYDRLIVFNVKNLDEKDFINLVKYFLNEIKLMSSISNNKNIIYIDEIWKYINTRENRDLSHIISEYFKTLRKHNLSIVAITQDITDFFTYENGNYGKTILNNSGFKLFFRLEYTDRKILESMNTISQVEISKIYKLDKGQALLDFCNNKVVINIKSSDFEEKLIKEEENEYFNCIK